jgi:hypothetical protein
VCAPQQLGLQQVRPRVVVRLADEDDVGAAHRLDHGVERGGVALRVEDAQRRQLDPRRGLRLRRSLRRGRLLLRRGRVRKRERKRQRQERVENSSVHVRFF